jgi:threonine/homoserine/homoserine lactone efflux protein
MAFGDLINNLLKGIVLGFSIAAPVGPIGVLCIRRTLAEGHLVGFVSGLGAATADLFYGALAAFGLTALSSWLIGAGRFLGLVGGLYLMFLGVRTFFSRPEETGAQPEPRRAGLWGAYLSTLFLTLTNPATILSFLAVFAGLGLAQQPQGGRYEASMLVLGVFMGSSTWWLLLSGGVSLLRRRVTMGGLTWVNRAAGVVLVGFGLVALILMIR